MVRDASHSYYYALNFSKRHTTAIMREENPHRILPPLQQKMWVCSVSPNFFKLLKLIPNNLELLCLQGLNRLSIIANVL